ncbi:MAG: MBL fold metallo-hydrolase [Methylocystaceae bacterium]|nr:MBL fold metallo-hydrolase [Methylocystaceae bacterium]
MSIEVVQFQCLADNFGLLVHDATSGATACVDAPDGAAIIAETARRGWLLTHLLLTHHHQDHIQGTASLKHAFPNMRVIGAKKDAIRLPLLDEAVVDGDALMIGASRILVMETPGHTLGHLAYYFEADDTVFVGDTLFSLGCGRVFEGTMEMMRDILRAAGEFTLPTTVMLESATNPFLRAGDAGVMKAMGLVDKNPTSVFTEMRERKNRFVA